MDLSRKKSFLQIWIYKKSNSTRTPLGPVRPVGLLPDRSQYQTGQTAWSDRSDRSRPILIVNNQYNRYTVLQGWRRKLYHPFNTKGLNKIEIAIKSPDPLCTESSRNPHQQGSPAPATAAQIRGSTIAQTL